MCHAQSNSKLCREPSISRSFLTVPFNEREPTTRADEPVSILFNPCPHFEQPRKPYPSLFLACHDDETLACERHVYASSVPMQPPVTPPVAAGAATPAPPPAIYSQPSPSPLAIASAKTGRRQLLVSSGLLLAASSSGSTAAGARAAGEEAGGGCWSGGGWPPRVARRGRSGGEGESKYSLRDINLL